MGRELLFTANRAGCLFPGKPLVEATGSLYNFSTQAGLLGIHKEEAYKKAVAGLINKVVSFSGTGMEKGRANASSSCTRAVAARQIRSFCGTW